MTLFDRLAGRVTGPAVVYLLAAMVLLAAALAGSLWVNVRQWRGGIAERAELHGVIDRAGDINAGQRAVIARAQQALAQCEAGRLFDASAQAAVLADRNAQFDALARRAAAERAAIAASNAGPCRAWAQQPACGVTP